MNAEGKPDQIKPAEGKRDEGKLTALPYLNWVPIKAKDRGRHGVTQHDAKRAYAGLNLYNSLPRAHAQLIDMQGKVVHSWRSTRGQPSPAEIRWHEIWSHLDFIGWQHVELAEEGGLYAILHMHGLLRLDRDSNVMWLAELGAHHDLDVAKSGEIYLLTAQERKLEHEGQHLVVLDNLVVVLGPDGEPQRKLSLLDALRSSPQTSHLVDERLDWSAKQLANAAKAFHLLAGAFQGDKEKLNRTAAAIGQILTGTFTGTPRVRRMLLTSLLPLDPLHANSVEILGRDVEGLGRRGNLLLSVRELDLVLVLDPRGPKVRWTYGPGTLERQHQPSLLANGNVLIFDNGPLSKRSRVLEVVPASKRVVWKYQAKPPARFFSPIRGGCQRLPNGNTLVVESERGRVFEITPGGEVVWELFNPDVRDPFFGRARAPIYRMTRIARDALDWLRTEQD